MTPINSPARFPPLLSKLLQDIKKYMQMSMTDLRTDWLIVYYALGRDKFCAKLSSERVDSNYIRACMWLLP